VVLSFVHYEGVWVARSVYGAESEWTRLPGRVRTSQVVVTVITRKVRESRCVTCGGSFPRDSRFIGFAVESFNLLQVSSSVSFPYTSLLHSLISFPDPRPFQRPRVVEEWRLEMSDSWIPGCRVGVLTLAYVWSRVKESVEWEIQVLRYYHLFEFGECGSSVTHNCSSFPTRVQSGLFKSIIEWYQKGASPLLNVAPM